MRSAASTAERMQASALSRWAIMPALRPSARVWSKPITSNCMASPLPSSQSGEGCALAIRQQILLVPMSSAVTIRWRLPLIEVEYPIPRFVPSGFSLGARRRNVRLRRCVLQPGRFRGAQAHRDPVEQTQIDGGDIAFQHAAFAIELEERGERLGHVVVGQHHLGAREKL